MEEPTPEPREMPNAVMDVKPPRAVAQPSADNHEPLPPRHHDKHEPKPEHPETPKDQPKPTTAPKQPGSGVGLAIFATVIIVFGLAALAVYAYLQQN